MFHKVGPNDIALVVSLGYMCMDVAQEWDNFGSCSKPIHAWLVVSCACAVAFRVMRFATSYMGDNVGAVDAGGVMGGLVQGLLSELLLLDLPLKGKGPQAVAMFMWLVVMPFFSLWNFMGTHWVWHVASTSPQCAPSDTHFWFSCLWAVVCNMWVLVHAALAARVFLMARAARSVQANLREVEDPESLARWGQVSSAAGSRPLSNLVASAGKGLPPAQIKALPCRMCTPGTQLECSICLTDVDAGEVLRTLPGCGHCFHRACIDLWLVRSADCPLCKMEVKRS